MAISLEELLLKIPDDTEERVDHTRTQINIEVREAIKRETGLVLNRKVTDQNRTNISVPVMLVPGIPEVLKRVIYDDIQGPLLMISPFRRHLEMASDSLGNIEPLVKILKSDGPPIQPGRCSSLQTPQAKPRPI